MAATDYLMVLPVRHFRLGDHLVAVEGAFAEHLRMMRNRFGPNLRSLVVASPAMSEHAYNAQSPTMSIVDEGKEGISFCTLFRDGGIVSYSDKARTFVSVTQRVYSSAANSICVHSGLSWDVRLPFEFASIIFGILLRKRTIFVVDIDYRHSARTSYETGDLSRKSYLICRYLYDKMRSLQIGIAVRFCSLVLLKGRKMVDDFGSGRPNVHHFLDASHSEANIIDAYALKQKTSLLRDKTLPLRMVYFGRLTAYKGIDRCIQAAAMAKRSGANVQLDVLGSGKELDALRRVSADCGANSFVNFLDGRPFNQEFFDLLSQYHLLLAAPLREDTPRSALDAMAAGVAYLAFDTYYYRELLESGAGRTVAWLDVDAMAAAIVELDQNRQLLIQMVEGSVGYARANTQEIWLERRLAWTLPHAADEGVPVPASASK